MRFLVLGSNGMAGHTISLYLYEQGYDVTTFSRSVSLTPKHIIGDALDQALLKSVLLDGNYDVVINCIGILNKACDKEPSKAVYLNGFLPHFIADTLKESYTRLIHMSTDCVFSGKNPPYYENSLRDGETLYDRTKAIGEIDDSKNLTFRNSIIGPDMKEKGIGLFNWFMKQEGTIYGYEKAIWTGVTTLTLAKAMEEAAKANLTGIYNLVSNESISKLNLLCLFNKHIRNDSINILPNTNLNIDKTLINTRKDFTFKVPSYEEMVIEMKEWIYEHRNLYPHYFKLIGK